MGQLYSATSFSGSGVQAKEPKLALIFLHGRILYQLTVIGVVLKHTVIGVVLKHRIILIFII